MSRSVRSRRSTRDADLWADALWEEDASFHFDGGHLPANQNVAPTSGMAYFFFLCVTRRPRPVNRVRWRLVTNGTGITAEGGLFYTDTPPDGTNKVIKKIAASALEDTTAGAPKFVHNSVNFGPLWIPEGVPLWGGIRLAGTLGQMVNAASDRGAGYMQQVAGAALLTTAGPWNGVIPAVADLLSPIGPYCWSLRG